MFSIVIPTWNNLDCLKLCVDSVRKHSAHDHEIIVHVNDGESDGTLAWVRAQGLKHSHARQNVGVCLSVNLLAAQASRDWLLYLNDDMVCCPGWDRALIEATGAAPANGLAMFFSTLVQPYDGGDSRIVVEDFGRAPAQFDEAAMLGRYSAQPRPDRPNSCSQPALVHRRWWNAVGGYSLEYGPGLSSDDDLLMKFFVVGCRTFVTVGASRVYHFAEKSTKRVRRNRGGRTFVLKWGITQQDFHRDFLARASDIPADRGLPHATLLGKLKRLSYGLADYPLGDLGAFDPAPGRHIDKA